MSPSRLFSSVLCLLCLALPALAEKKPNDSRSLSTDSRATEDSRSTMPEIKDVGGRTIEVWVADLRHADPYHRGRALMAIVQFGERAGTYVPEVVKLLHDGDAGPRMKAIIALRMMYIPQTHRGLVIKELGRCLVNLSSQTIHRYEAVKTLMRFGALFGDEREAVIDIAQNLGSPFTYELRSLCIDGLLTAGVDEKKGPDPRVTDALITRANSYKEPAEEVRFKAIMALGAMGRPQDPKKLAQVVNVLRLPNNLNSHNRIIRMWTHVSLMALDEKVPEKEMQNIVKLLDDPEAHIRIQAITALGALRDKSHAYVGKICDMVRKEKDPMVLLIVCQALGRMGTRGDKVVKTLVEITELEQTKYVSAVIAACNALKELGVNDAATLEAVEKVLKHPSLEDYQKEPINKILDAMKHPPKTPAKDAPRVPK